MTKNEAASVAQMTDEQIDQMWADAWKSLKGPISYTLAVRAFARALLAQAAPPAAPVQGDERKLFEARGYKSAIDGDFIRDGDGQYANRTIQHRWEAWRERARIARGCQYIDCADDFGCAGCAAPAAPATGESGAEPVAWINKETLRELVENPRKRLTQVWLNPEKTAEDDTPLVSLESLMNNPFAAAAAWRNKSCKWCGGAGWYTSHTTGYPHEMPCRYCNPNGESKATHRATRPASKSAPEGESNA